MTHSRIKRWGAGRVLVPRDFLDLGDRGAVDIALHRLMAAGKIRRLARGLYDYPKTHPRYGRLTPATHDIATAIARSTGETVVFSDAAAANMLGLSTQVPARAVYLTDGTTRALLVGNRTIQFKHVAPSRMAGLDTRPGLVLRALRFLGSDSIDSAVDSQLRSILTDADCRSLRALRPHAPSWMHAALDRIVTRNRDDAEGRNYKAERRA